MVLETQLWNHVGQVKLLTTLEHLSALQSKIPPDGIVQTKPRL